jgi:hypothetical protein
MKKLVIGIVILVIAIGSAFAGGEMEGVPIRTSSGLPSYDSLDWGSTQDDVISFMESAYGVTPSERDFYYLEFEMPSTWDVEQGEISRKSGTITITYRLKFVFMDDELVHLKYYKSDETSNGLVIGDVDAEVSSMLSKKAYLFIREHGEILRTSDSLSDGVLFRDGKVRVVYWEELMFITTYHFEVYMYAPTVSVDRVNQYLDEVSNSQ